MTGFLRMTKLDFFTMKSQLFGYLSLVVVVLMFEFIESSFTVLCITAAWFMALMGTNIFAIQEKNNLDRLYGSVSVRLNEIVMGRYISVMLSYLIALFVVVVLHFGFVLYRNASFDVLEMAVGFSVSLLVFSIITGLQMPLFFKMGYTKAKIWSLVPFMAVMGLIVIPSFVPTLSGIIKFMQSHTEVLVIGGILVSCIIQVLSYNIAVVFYRKRK